jgi:hypothetical protein
MKIQDEQYFISKTNDLDIHHGGTTKNNIIGHQDSFGVDSGHCHSLDRTAWASHHHWG